MEEDSEEVTSRDSLIADNGASDRLKARGHGTRMLVKSISLERARNEASVALHRLHSDLLDVKQLSTVHEHEQLHPRADAQYRLRGRREPAKFSDQFKMRIVLQRRAREDDR